MKKIVNVKAYLFRSGLGSLFFICMNRFFIFQLTLTEVADI